jgi:hypothetical protein
LIGIPMPINAVAFPGHYKRLVSERSTEGGSRTFL